jgi:MoaA/NifB/PqqE/SkfB family radical SAM enzyme
MAWEWWEPRHYVSMTMEFRCNLRCNHCMIEGTMDRLAPQEPGRFEQVLAERARRGWTGLILTGSEITLHRDLPDMARRARAAGFQHVRIQTHGMRLADAEYLARLVDAGVDEFFVSIAGATAQTHDRITTVAGSFEKSVRGLENLDAFGERVIGITNTVVTAENIAEIAAVPARLAHATRLVQMEYWNYFPMAEEDVKSLVVPLSELIPALRAALAATRANGRRAECKNVPACALGDDEPALVNMQPELLIDPAFWDEFRRNGFYQCVHREACAHPTCLGLNTAYMRRFGDEAERLTPYKAQALSLAS